MRFDQLPKEELKRISTKGGIASGIARREKRKQINAIKLNRIAERESNVDFFKATKEIALILKSRI